MVNDWRLTAEPRRSQARKTTKHAISWLYRGRCTVWLETRGQTELSRNLNVACTYVSCLALTITRNCSSDTCASRANATVSRYCFDARPLSPIIPPPVKHCPPLDGKCKSFEYTVCSARTTSFRFIAVRPREKFQAQSGNSGIFLPLRGDSSCKVGNCNFHLNENFFLFFFF